MPRSQYHKYMFIVSMLIAFTLLLSACMPPGLGHHLRRAHDRHMGQEGEHGRGNWGDHHHRGEYHSQGKQDMQSGSASEEMAESDSNLVEVTFLQVNDVYEITPVSNGTQGGLSRLATVKNDLLAENPNTYLVLAGDLFSPSALGTAKVDGERLSGKQAVAVMNAVGLDYAAFGNHEFDIDEEQFYSRLEESETTWISSNAFDADQNPFPNVPEQVIFSAENGSGNSVNIGIFAIMIDSNPVEYVTYTDPYEAAAEQVASLRDQVDILIAITHLSVAEDIQLAEKFPEIDIILGGHEHENIQVWRGAGMTPVFKADANARSAYVHHLAYDTETGSLAMKSYLQLINDSIADDPEVEAIVQEWLDIGFEGFRTQGFEPEAAVTNLTEPLDGTEASVRNKPTRLTELTAAGMLHTIEGAELAIFNSGSIRIDDTLQPGVITQYDIIRVLPFGGVVKAVEMKGSLLQEVLDQGEANQGTGGYLQTANVEFGAAESNWLINGIVIDADETYLVAMNDFLLTGWEIGLDFLTTDNSDLTVQETEEEVDIRNALIDELEVVYGPIE